MVTIGSCDGLVPICLPDDLSGIGPLRIQWHFDIKISNISWEKRILKCRSRFALEHNKECSCYFHVANVEKLFPTSCRVFTAWYLFRYMALLKPIKYNKVGIIKNICDHQWFQCRFVNQSSFASWPMGSGDIPENPEFWSRIWPIYSVKQRKEACVKKEAVFVSYFHWLF